MASRTPRLSTSERLNAQAKVRAYDDPFWFGYHILGRDMLVPRIHGRMLRDLQLHDKLLILEPREHLKTTTITEVYLTWRIIRNPDLRALIVHKPLKRAYAFLRVIRDHFEHNEALRKLFGDFTRRTRWGDTEFVVSKRRSNFKEPTLMVASPDHDPTGGHFNVILPDDMVGIKDRYSKATRTQSARYFKALWAMLLKGGQMPVTGTRWHGHDMYCTEILGDPKMRIPGRDDFHTTVTQIYKEDGSIYFPEQFDEERIEGLRTGMGPTLFSAQEMNDPIAEGLRRFDLDNLHYYEPRRIEGRAFAFIDPATGEDLDKGDSTFLAVGLRTKQKLYLDYARLENESFERFVPHLVAAAKRYHFPSLYVEANGFQTFFAKDCARALKKAGLTVRIRKVKQHISKQRRIDSMESVLLDGQVLFRTDWDVAYPGLMQQLAEWPNVEHDDGPDGLEGLIAAALGRGVKRKIVLL